MKRLIYLFLAIATPVSAQETFKLWTRHLDYENKCVDHVLEQLGTSKDVWSSYEFRRRAPEAFKKFVTQGGNPYLYVPLTNFHIKQWLESFPISEIKNKWCVRADVSKPFGLDNRVYYDSAKMRPIFNVTSPSFQRWAATHLVELAGPYAGIGGDNVLMGEDRMKRYTVKHPNWEYAGRIDDWNHGMIRYLSIVQSELRANGRRLCVNTTLDMDGDDHWWKLLVLEAKVDAVLTERYPGKDAVASLARVKWIMANGSNLWVALYGHNAISDVGTMASIEDSDRLRVNVFLIEHKRDVSDIVRSLQRAMR